MPGKVSSQFGILAQVLEIRDRVNAPWKHYQLRQDRRLFSQVCSSMDTIEDTAFAVHAFETESLPTSAPALYLIVYGLLQALYLQQDAVFHLTQALGSPAKRSAWPDLEDVRYIRNAAVGHPTKKDRPKPVSFHHITQVTLSRAGFEMLSYVENGDFQHDHVDFAQLISKQAEAISAILSGLVTQLTEEAIKHKERFRMEKLAQLFRPATSYHLEKVAEGVHQEPRIGLFGLDGIERTINAFREAVGRRDMDYYDALEHDYQLLGHAIGGLRGFLEDRVRGAEPSLSPLTAEIYVAYLREQTDDLRGQAREIDEDYAE